MQHLQMQPAAQDMTDKTSTTMKTMPNTLPAVEPDTVGAAELDAVLPDPVYYLEQVQR